MLNIPSASIQWARRGGHPEVYWGPLFKLMFSTQITYLRRSMFRQLMEEGQGQERESGSVKKIREEGKGQWRGLW